MFQKRKEKIMDIEKFDRKMSDALIRKLTRKQAKNFIRTGKDYNSENNVELEKAEKKINNFFNNVLVFGFFPSGFLWLVISFFDSDVFKKGGILFVSFVVFLTFLEIFAKIAVESYYDFKYFKKINFNEMDEILNGFSSSSELIEKGIFVRRFLRNKINVEKTVEELELDYLMQETKQNFQQEEELSETKIDSVEQKLDFLYHKLKEKLIEKWNSNTDKKEFFYEIKEFDRKYKNEISLPYKNLSDEKIKDAKIFLKNMEENSDELYEHFKTEQKEKKTSILKKSQKYMFSTLTLLAGTVFLVFMKNTNLFLISLFVIGICGFTIEQCFEWFMKHNYFFNRKEIEWLIKKYLPEEKILSLENGNSNNETLQLELNNSENIIEKLIGKQKDKSKYEYRNETELFKMFKKFNSEKELISSFSKKERILKAAEFLETLKENEIKNNL
jgi:hypothetical protein